jgi:hypothetical protein
MILYEVFQGASDIANAETSVFCQGFSSVVVFPIFVEACLFIDVVIIERICFHDTIVS